MTKVFRTILILTLVTTMMLTTGPLWAQTGDGEVPAVEEVCDDDPFNFGLCNAYCEALDCDSDTPIGSPRACERVLNNYHRHSDGIDPPCVVVACPCAFDLVGDLEFLAEQFTVEFGGDTLDFDTLQTLCLDIPEVNGVETHVAQVFEFPPSPNPTPQGVRLLYDVDGNTCNELGGTIDGLIVSVPEDYLNIDYTTYIDTQETNLDQDEVQACEASLAALCAAVTDP